MSAGENVPDPWEVVAEGLTAKHEQRPCRYTEQEQLEATAVLAAVQFLRRGVSVETVERMFSRPHLAHLSLSGGELSIEIDFCTCSGAVCLDDECVYCARLDGEEGCPADQGAAEEPTEGGS